MAENSKELHLTPTEEENESAEVYSISQDQNGTFHFSRRDFLLLGMAAGGALLAKGLCPRFGERVASSTTQPLQAGMMPLPRVYLHAGPNIDSDIVDSLQQNDIVLLLGDHPEVGWVQIATRSGKQGWLKRTYVDFTRAITSSSPNFNFNGVVSQKPALQTLSVQVSHKPALQKNSARAGRTQACGDAIQNGDFEGGHVNWIEESNHGTDVLITNTWPDPYQGSNVALLGGEDYATDKLTQVIHLPADVQDVQLFEYYLKMTTEEISTENVYDWLVFRLLDAGGTPITNDVAIADNIATVPDWSQRSIQISGLSTFAGQDIQVQFEAYNDVSNISQFVIDSVSFNLDCGSTPTPTRTSTRTATATPTRTSTKTSTPTRTPTFPPIQGTNLALGKATTASSIENNDTSNWGPQNAVDGDLVSRWSSEFSDPQWLQIDLGALSSIDHIRLVWEAAYAQSYQIQVSNNGSTWTDIFTATTGNGGLDDISNLTGIGRYIRLYATARGTAYGYSLHEFEVYGVPVALSYIYLPIVLNQIPTSTPSETPTATSTNTPTETPTQTNTPVPCNCDSLPTCSCNSGTPCTCNSNPCSCDIGIPTCSCNGFNPCSCDIAIPTCACNGFNPCSCDIAIPTCACNGFNPCSCDIAIPTCACNGFNPCTCNVAPCSCNIAPCSCNIAPCSCNIAPCSCNVFPCSCNVFPCSCNISPCSCNTNFCSCNSFGPCAIT